MAGKNIRTQGTDCVEPDGQVPLEYGHPLLLGTKWSKRLKNPDDFDRMFGRVTPSDPGKGCGFADPEFDSQYMKPFLLVGAGTRIQFDCHSQLGDTLETILKRIAAIARETGLSYKIRSLVGYDPRYQVVSNKVRTNKEKEWYGFKCKYQADPLKYRVSCHAWGVAFDVNAATNKQNTYRGDIPTAFINQFEREGFLWGGRFRGDENDPMHFEWASPRVPTGK